MPFVVSRLQIFVCLAIGSSRASNPLLGWGRPLHPLLWRAPRAISSRRVDFGLWRTSKPPLVLGVNDSTHP
ncbi:unnamed protein product [Amoebophrya sp. A120]|nr:unnamed protein product [Amoebophrya sp. A120]|eukprot:GSA120T00019523001.1